MQGWELNIWQRAIFGLGSLILFAASLIMVTESHADAALIPFLWALILAAVAASPRLKQRPAE